MNKTTHYFFLSAIALLFTFQRTIAEKNPNAITNKNVTLLTPLDAPNYKHAYQGEQSPMKVMMSNYGSVGRAAWTPTTGQVSPAETLGCEYPNGSGMEHIYGGGLWVGGIIDTSVAGGQPGIKVVTTGYEGNGAVRELYPGTSPGDKLWIVRDTIKPPDWDSYWGSAIPFKKISDEDFYCRYRDFNTGVNVNNHIPLNIEVIQKSFSWRSDYAGAIVPIDLRVINQGTRVIQQAYIGYFIDTDVGPYYQTTGRGYSANYYSQNFSGYVSNLHLAYAHNPVTRGSTPFGCVLVHSDSLPEALHYTYQWLDFTTNNIPDDNDQQRYDNLMARGTIAQNQSPEITQLSDTRFIFSFGPFTINPSDTLNVVIALVSGEDLTQLKENASRAVEIYRLGYKLPYIPPSPKPIKPKLTYDIGFKKIILRWDNTAESAWDDSNHIAEADSVPTFPGDTTFRHPPGSGRKGGYVFEGYRIYRSLDPSPNPPVESFTLLRQVDVKDDEFEFNTGLEYSYEDSELVRGNSYWYAVTSFAIPNEFSQVVGAETTFVRTTPLESSIRENWTRVVLPFSSATKQDEVIVVPNPYRVDADYTYENGGWEGKTIDWSEDKRLIRFIHVPEKCTIRIFTLAGDLVETLNHDVSNDAIKRGEVEWNLLSRSNRAIASGIYVFTVESDQFKTQVGKFVIIR